jgi:hypothetical protein
MSYEFRPAKRENVPLLIGLAGYTGSGKTYSALLLAKGLAGSKPFAVIDTENGRASHYADDFSFESTDLRAPFRPQSYADAIQAADKAGYPVVVVDSMSHEYSGDGGILDWHESELSRMAGDDYKKREAMTFAAWVKPKQAHKRMVSQLLQVRAHVILCFRAEEKIEIVKKDGKTVVQPKRTLAGGSLDGWIPITEKTLPYEMTVSFLLSPSSPGVPRPIKLQEQHKPMVPLDKPISEQTGELLGKWAAGSKQKRTRKPTPAPEEAQDNIPFEAAVDTGNAELAAKLVELATERGVAAEAKNIIDAKRLAYKDDPARMREWLEGQIARAEEQVPA